MAWACATMRTGSQVAETTGRDRRPRARAIPPCRMPAARKAAVKRGPSRPRLAAHNHARELCDLTGRHGRPGRCTRTHSRQSRCPQQQKRGKGKNRKRAGQEGTVAEARRGRGREGTDTGVPWWGRPLFSTRIAMSRSHIVLVHAARQSWTQDAGHEPAAGSRPLPFPRLSADREEELLVPGAGGESRARRCRAPGSYWWLSEASDGWLALLGGGGRRTGGGPWWVGLPGLVVSKRYRWCKLQDMPNYCRWRPEKNIAPVQVLCGFHFCELRLLLPRW